MSGENTVSSDEKARDLGAEPWPNENQVFAAAMTCAASEPSLVMVKEADWQRLHDELERAKARACYLFEELARKDQALDEIRALHKAAVVDVTTGAMFCAHSRLDEPCEVARILSDLAAALDAHLNKENDSED